MRNNLFLRGIAIFIMILLVVFIASCSSKIASDEQNTKNDNISQDQENGFPISKEKITLKILKPLVMYDTNYSEMPVLQEYEKKTNIHIEWISPPAAEFTQKYQLMMTSGDLPDAIIAMPADDIERYGQQGVLVDLTELIDKYMPNLQKVFEQYPEAKKIVTSSDGKIYSMPYVYRQRWGNNVMIIREDWLKKLNLQMPETTDEWYNVLKAFKTQLSNGKEIWPFSGDSINDARSLSSAWGIYDGFYVADKLHPKDGKVHYGPIEPRMKEALTWVNKLYKEGLIDPEIVTNDVKLFQAKMTQNLVGATRGVFGGDLITMNDTARKNGDMEFHLVVAPVIKGPYGDQLHPWPDPHALPQGFVITRANKYPVETAKWADYWYSEEGQKSLWGIEGKNWEMVDGKPRWTDWMLNNPEGKLVDEVWGSLTPGRSIWPTVWLPADLILQRDSEEVRYAKQHILTEDVLVEPLPPKLPFTQEENNRRVQLMNDIQTFVDESITNFIIGRSSLSDWDKYVEQVKSMGIDEVLDIYQKAYDRWNSISVK